MSGRYSFALRFYLGLGAPGKRTSFLKYQVRAAVGYESDLIHTLLTLYRKETDAGSVEQVNFRCAIVTPDGENRKFFVKEFPHNRPLHGLETAIRCSRVDRAWRAAHLLPSFGLLTPRAVGSAVAKEPACEYLITEWLPEARPYHQRLREVNNQGVRLAMLTEFAHFLHKQHKLGIYLRDLVTNVLTRETPDGREYWLTDLDQLHPIRRLTRKRILHQMSQVARWTGPLTEEEVGAIISTCFGPVKKNYYERVESVLFSTPPAAL